MVAKVNKLSYKFVVAILFILSIAVPTLAQTNLLARKITIDISMVELKVALTEIGEIGN